MEQQRFQARKLGSPAVFGKILQSVVVQAEVSQVR
jgi:hypothetical protein